MEPDALRLLQAPLKERYCVILRTLRNAPPVSAALHTSAAA